MIYALSALQGHVVDRGDWFGSRLGAAHYENLINRAWRAPLWRYSFWIVRGNYSALTLKRGRASRQLFDTRGRTVLHLNYSASRRGMRSRSIERSSLRHQSLSPLAKLFLRLTRMQAHLLHDALVISHGTHRLSLSIQITLSHVRSRNSVARSHGLMSSSATDHYGREIRPVLK